MVKTPGMILFETLRAPPSFGWEHLDERVRAQFELEGAAVWNAALDAAALWMENEGRWCGFLALKVQP